MRLHTIPVGSDADGKSGTKRKKIQRVNDADRHQFTLQRLLDKPNAVLIEFDREDRLVIAVESRLGRLVDLHYEARWRSGASGAIPARRLAVGWWRRGLPA